MTEKYSVPELDYEKLLDNALTSIRLGVEDFERCYSEYNEDYDPARALSAVRNLFSGLLLLFKFKIAASVIDPVEAATLIFIPPEVIPRTDGKGGVEWLPKGKFKAKTIDIATIKKRFEMFNINVDWKTVDKLQECRNRLEHLHPDNTLGEVTDFVSELFPVLRDFIQNELAGSPVELLGVVWQIMLLHHNFFEESKNKCKAEWEKAGMSEHLRPLLDKAFCEDCGSCLILPAHGASTSTIRAQDGSIAYICYECSSIGATP